MCEKYATVYRVTIEDGVVYEEPLAAGTREACEAAKRLMEMKP